MPHGWGRSGTLTTAGAKSNPQTPWGRARDSASGHHFYSDRGVHPSVEDFHYGAGMVADDSFEKALSTLLESTDVTT